MTLVSSLPWRALRAPKCGYTDADYEDAWAVAPAVGRFAVVDGASESSYSKLWARLLAESFVAARRPWDQWTWLDEPRRQWSAAVDGLELPWYAEEKREQGAFATLLGLAVRSPIPGQPGLWRALAVGDSCLIRVRDEERPESFPLSKSAEFNNRPKLLGSRPGSAPSPAHERGLCRAGDYLLLMTDALAQWFLRCREKGRRPWDDIQRLLSETDPDAAFAAWVEESRAHDQLRNDDVTLLAIGPIHEAPMLPKEESP